MTARKPKAYRRLASSSWVADSSIQNRNAHQSPNPLGTRTPGRVASQNSIGTARMTQMTAASPSTHQSGKATSSSGTGQPSGRRGRRGRDGAATPVTGRRRGSRTASAAARSAP